MISSILPIIFFVHRRFSESILFRVMKLKMYRLQFINQEFKMDKPATRIYNMRMKNMDHMKYYISTYILYTYIVFKNKFWCFYLVLFFPTIRLYELTSPYYVSRVHSIICTLYIVHWSVYYIIIL